MRGKSIVLYLNLSLLLLTAFQLEVQADSSCHGSNAGMTTGSKGLILIKSFAGLRLKAYQDVVRVWRIGYGHRHGVQKGQIITEKQAEKFLKEDLRTSERAVIFYVKAKLNQDQFDALVSWTFNLGSGSLRSSTMRRKLNKCNYAAVPCEMMRWVKAGGEVYRGLERRRRAEGELFNGGDFHC